MLNNGCVEDSLTEMFRLFAKWEEGAEIDDTTGIGQGMMDPNIESDKEMGSDCSDETDETNHEEEGLQKYDEITKKDFKSMVVEDGMATEDPEEAMQAENSHEIGEEKSEKDDDTVTAESFEGCDTFELAQISGSGSIPRDDDDTTVSESWGSSFIDDYYFEDVLTQNDPCGTVAIYIDTDSERKSSERPPTEPLYGMFSRVLQIVLSCLWYIFFLIVKLRLRLDESQSRNTSTSSFLMLDECWNSFGTNRRWKFCTLFSMAVVVFIFIFYQTSVYIST